MEVKSGVPKGSVLAPLMFLVVYVNDMTKGVSSYINLFVDGAKWPRKVGQHTNYE